MAGRTQYRAVSGFTLIELLVVICLLVIVLSLVLPALAGARSSARQAVCLSNLRQVGVAMELYTRENRDVYPFSPADTWWLMAPPDDPSRPLTKSNQHFVFTRYWPAVMHRTSPWREHFAAWVCPGAKREPAAPWDAPRGGGEDDLWAGSSYEYTRAFIARPELWSDTPAEPLTQWLKPVRTGDVLSPARKVMLFDQEMAHQALQTMLELRPMLFADGHSAVHDRGLASEPVLNRVAGDARRLHDTRDGVRGVDY